MKEFKQFYVWGMNAKFFMGLYFVATVFFVGIVRFFGGSSEISLWHLAQILMVDMIIAFTQALVLNDKTDYSRGIFFGRSVAWLLFSAGLTVGASILFGWFEGMPIWCNALVGVLMLVGFGATLIGLKFEQEQDTQRLNSSLNAFKKQ